VSPRSLLDWLRRVLRREGRSSADPPGGATGAAGPAAHRVEQSHEEIADYWTDERVRGARPREVQRSIDAPGESRE
jgi:hypothetical protein